MQSFVKLVNNSDQPISLPYRDPSMNNREVVYTLEPGKPKIVPWDVMILFCGNPQERNQEYWRARDEAVRNLRVLYGSVRLDEEPVELPDIRAYDVETDEEIHTLLTDPDGEHLGLASPETSDVAALSRQIVALQEELARMQGRQPVDVEEPILSDEVAAEDIPVDTPTKPKVGGRRRS